MLRSPVAETASCAADFGRLRYWSKPDPNETTVASTSTISGSTSINKTAFAYISSLSLADFSIGGVSPSTASKLTQYDRNKYMNSMALPRSWALPASNGRAYCLLHPT